MRMETESTKRRQAARFAKKHLFSLEFLVSMLLIPTVHSVWFLCVVIAAQIAVNIIIGIAIAKNKKAISKRNVLAFAVQTILNASHCVIYYYITAPGATAFTIIEVLYIIAIVIFNELCPLE